MDTQGQQTQIRISWPAGHLTATLDHTATTQAFLKALPLTASAHTWGEEVYFDTGMSVSRETNARQVVEPGTVVFWTDGDALALPYGPTPISQGWGSPRSEFGGECRLASPCNVMGRLNGDPRLLATVRGGDPIRVEAVDA
ncbi:cyclophilin-like fold protein [Streptomyces poriticola]|uniref:cyclophilin-like fold protein n=1 Tax=Streptomyces poriticola TaxID=3120506 RepID=UPI002FCDECC3